VRVDTPKAIKFYEKICEEEDAEACKELGVLHYGNKSYSKAAKSYTKACALKNGEACYWLGILYGEKEGVALDICKMLDYFKKACDNGYYYGCSDYEYYNYMIRISGKTNGGASCETRKLLGY
jgi:TPR repeat protein